jgi:hypothetical protein
MTTEQSDQIPVTLAVTKPKFNILFSWQTDNRLIGTAFQQTLKSVTKNLELNYNEISRAIGNNTLAIKKQILECSIFVADISMISGTVNPNVMFELGLASGLLKPDQILCICNKQSMSGKELPFDIKHIDLLLLDSENISETELIITNHIKLYQENSEENKIIKKLNEIHPKIYQTITQASAFPLTIQFPDINEKLAKLIEQCAKEHPDYLEASLFQPQGTGRRILFDAATYQTIYITNANLIIKRQL